MNRQLLESIVRHVFANLAVIPSEFVNIDKTRSLLEPEWLLKKTLTFTDENENHKGQVWGCQLSADTQEVRMLLGDCSQEPGVKEYCLIVSLKNAPSYGLYWIQSDSVENEPLIACSVNGTDWLECNTFLQASFLAGMEQIRETGLAWNKCKSYDEEFAKMISFIEYHHHVYGETDEGQENGL